MFDRGAEVEGTSSSQEAGGRQYPLREEVRLTLLERFRRTR